MKRFILGFSILLSLLNTLRAQNINWNSAPQTGFVFQITNKEAVKLLTKSVDDTLVNAMLHTVIDTFNVAKGWTHRPDKGHFIMGTVRENKLHCEYTSVFPYQVLLLQEYNALALQVLDHDGNIREDAKVKFKTRRIRLDMGSKTYRIENDWFTANNKIVTVELNGFRSVFNIEKHDVPSWSHDYNRHEERPAFYSYMITDKNKYKPGERVRFKSYALTGSRSPLRKDLEGWLMVSGKSLRVTRVSPHRPGSFAGEFYLHDSLKLTLDKYYTLQLREKDGRIVSNCNFKYEDYELHSNTLQVDLTSGKHFYPESNYITIKATNENGLLLKDARATVAILTENIREIFQPVVTLRDTLMFKEINLNADAPTIVEIPAALFEKSNTSYFVHVSITDSQHQLLEKSLPASYQFSNFELVAKYLADSIVYTMLNNGSPMQNVPVKIFYDGETDGVNKILPYREKINPATSSVRVEGNPASRTFRMMDMLPKITFTGGIQKDSFNIAVDNPQKILLAWNIYQGSILIAKGSGIEINYKSRIEDRSETYYAELLYSFGGVDHVTTKEFEFREASLDISLNVPDRVYPGQKVDATIEVTDEAGRPVGGVDLTAFATTAKLNYILPDLPYYGTTSQSRSEKATYSKDDLDVHKTVLDLDYAKWVTRLQLDTMKYYQFTYPGKDMFVYQHSITDSTQFAPYVMKNGLAKQIYVIEVDGTPVHYSWTDHPSGYSFYVEPEKQKQVTLRLHDRVLTFDSLCFDVGKKTIFSVDLDHLPQGVRVHRIAPEFINARRKRKPIKWVFTDTEVNRYKQYLAAFKSTTYPSYLYNDKIFVPLSYGGRSEKTTIAGPIPSGMLTYTEDSHLATRYRNAGGFSYTFEDNIVYKLEPPRLIPVQLFDVSVKPLSSLNDVAINKKRFLEQHVSDPERWYPRVIDLADHVCHVKLFLPDEEAKSGVASILFQDCKTHNVILPCRDYFIAIPHGYHNLIVLYNNRQYLKVDSVNLQPYTEVVADLNYQSLHAADTMAENWLKKTTEHCLGMAAGATHTITITNRSYVRGNVQGDVFDDLNEPLPGVVIIVKGTTIGTTTDVNGHFILDIPEDPSVLVASFIGYKTQEFEVRPGSQIALVMETDIQELQEVVVVGYGTQSRRELTAAAVSLQGRIAGVTIARRGEQQEIEADGSNEESREAEQKLYRELLTLKSIRSQFSDVGFWEPRLFTDRHGKSTFTITFPDDITRWDAAVYAMNRHLQTGMARKSIKSYKPLMAELHVPQFLTVGDSANFLGKVLNYTADKTIKGKTQWTSTTTVEKDVTFENFYAERLPVQVASLDTITTRYAFTRRDGYFDGEERSVPVVEQGTLRASGTLSMLKNNDELHAQSAKGTTTKLEIFDNQLDLYAGDVQSLVHYRYDCNEQLASKLIALLNYKLLKQYEGKDFNYDKDVNKIIQRLLKNQNSEFLWSWWDVSTNTSYWMSAHILRALKAASDAGYAVSLNLENVVRKATYKYEFLKQLSIADVQLIHALAVWNVKLNYAAYVNTLDKQVHREDSLAREYRKKHLYTPYSLLDEKLLLLEIRQLQHLPFVRDSLLQHKKQTILNEVYFGDERAAQHWYTGNLLINATAYRIIKRDSVLNNLIVPMQMYFLSLRRKGEWNTYETSNVLMSILPDLIAQGSTKKVPASIALTGKVNGQVQKFPYKLQLAGGEELTIRKEAGLPLYCMQYTEERVTKSKAGTDAFQIKTMFNDLSMKAGKPAILKAVVEVKRDSKLEHVMIEIPIPAGCSYADKRQFDNAIETHREYFKEKTVIFCENMTAGTYIFQVQLLPRFTGKYIVNPAQISLMYFPVINANTDMKKVIVGE